MTPNEAAQILEALAKGIDPETGEVFPGNSPLNNPHVIRALFMGARAVADPASQPRPKRPQVEGQEQAWQPWTREEEESLLAAFDCGATIQELASAHKRKVGGITARLVKLGRLEPGTTFAKDAT